MLLYSYIAKVYIVIFVNSLILKVIFVVFSKFLIYTFVCMFLNVNAEMWRNVANILQKIQLQ